MATTQLNQKKGSSRKVGRNKAKKIRRMNSLISAYIRGKISFETYNKSSNSKNG